jgi:hypothetical protein
MSAYYILYIVFSIVPTNPGRPIFDGCKGRTWQIMASQLFLLFCLQRIVSGSHLFLCKWQTVLWAPSRRNRQAQMFSLWRGENCHDASKRVKTHHGPSLNIHKYLLMNHYSWSCRMSAPRPKVDIGTLAILLVWTARGHWEARGTSWERASPSAWDALTTCMQNFATLVALSLEWMMVWWHILQHIMLRDLLTHDRLE